MSQSPGRKRGPRFKLTPEQAAQVKAAYEDGVLTVDDIARQFSVTRQTIYNVLKRLREDHLR
jgi:DNA invertase Pin-like site-specific DNA recombinase